MSDRIEFHNVHEESEERIREAVRQFREKYGNEEWGIAVYGLPEAPSFKVHVTTPAPELQKSRPFLVPNTLNASGEIFAVLERMREEWQIRTTPQDSK